MSDFQITRRSVLQAAAGLGLSFLMPAMSARAANERGSKRKKSLIVLWMGGGPSQLETWDPKPGTKSGGDVKAISTSIPGLSIADMYPQTASKIGELSVIRSLTSKEGDHERGTYHVKTGYRPAQKLVHPAVSAIVSHKTSSKGLEIPAHVSLGNSQWPARGGYLGDSLDAFRIFNPGRQVRNMKARVGEDRQESRLKGLSIVSQSFARGRRVQTDRTLHQETISKALKMMNSEQLKAFNIDAVPGSLKVAYGDNRFGSGCLVARQLIETGVRAVEVNLPGWDTHTSNHEGCQTQSKMLDPAFATLIQDLKDRDLLESTVVLCIGEFGRTPTINPLGGRDHWPRWFSCVVGGGGLKKGVVIGDTDPAGLAKPVDEVEIKDLYATIFRTLNIDHEEEIITNIGRSIKISEGTPIAKLLPNS
jgi:hypothetical protein